MNILAFDTGLNKTFLALKTNKNIFSEIIESTPEKYHSAYLIQKIVDILSVNNLRLQDIDLIATNVGPGSFTGIRVGLTVARGISQGTGANAIGVNSLELISKAYGENAITVLDARKNKAYIGNQEKLELIDLDVSAEYLKNHNGEIIADTRMQSFLAENGIDSINFENDNKDFGKVLLNMAICRFSNNEYTNWQGLKPLYIQPPPIHQKNN